MNIDVTIRGEEVLLRLDQLPRKIREEIRDKFTSSIFPRMTREILSGTPGKFIDPRYIQTGVEQIGSLVIGFLEVEDKPGVYAIYPDKARILRFVGKSGEIVRTRRVLNHPYLKGAPVVERYLLENKPWLVEEVQEAVVEAISRRRG